MGWPTSKEQAAKCKQEVERTQAELDWDAKLKRINSLAFELQVLVKMRQFGAERQRYQLSEVAKKITEAAK
jgi:hypothetical protein